MKPIFLLFFLGVISGDPGFAYGAPGRIIPSTHTISLAIPEKRGEAGRHRYRSFDREAILRRIAADTRYTEALDRMKKSMVAFASLSDEYIRSLIPPAATKRAFMVHRSGCPVHGGGTGVYQPFGTRVDITHPLMVQCPIGKEWYPNEAFPDDGSGWLDNRPGSPTKGERYYFVGWFNQWFLNSIPQYLKPLAMLWFLTGEDIYRQKALVLLERFMEVYPDISAKDLTYDGADWGVYVKMTGSYWEGSLLLELAKSVEILAPALPESTLARVEERIYRPAFEAYRSRPASGNWGNNWNMALAKFAAVSGDGEMLRFMLYDHPAAEAPVLDNQFFRDGFPYEASLSYASTYHAVAKNIAEAMGPDGRWVWDNPHIRASFHSFADLVCLDRFTHFAADMGSIINTGWTLPSADIADAYRAYRTPELARYLLRAIEISGSPAPALDDLFREPLDMDEVRRTAALAPEEKSTLAPVRGLTILRTGKGAERAALVLDYGYAHSAHSHADRLNINLFAAGREFIPEMGYPEYMDHIAPATGGWTTNTVCHATVEVDERRQAPGTFGDLHAFADLEGIKAVDASCEDAYAWRGVDRYRRTLLLIEIPGGSYVVDLFRVKGGSRHDYLFHGPVGDLHLDGPQLSEPAPGTLAGPDVPFGRPPEGIKPYDLENSGYQYLFDVRTGHAEKPFSAVWTMPDSLRFRVVFVPEDAETFIRATGYPRPSTRTFPPMPFFLRRHDRAASAESRFATVMSFERDAPVIRSVRRIELEGDSGASGYGLEVIHSYGRDVILSTVSSDARIRSSDGRFELNGMLGVASWRKGRLERLTLIGGTEFRAGKEGVRLDSPLFATTVRDVLDDRVVLSDPLPADAKGGILLAGREPVRSAYRIMGMKDRTVDISPSTWIGRGRVGSVNDSTRTILDGRNIFPLGETPAPRARNYYAGAWITTPDGGFCCRLKTGGNGGFVLDEKSPMGNLKAEFPSGRDFLLYDLGPGDRVYVVKARQVVFK